MTLNTILIICFFINILFIVIIISRWRKSRWLIRGIGSTITLASFAVSIALLLLVSNLYSYQRLAFEQQIARAEIVQLGPKHYQLNLIDPQNQTLIFDIFGDDWQIDARVLKWHSYANLIGLDLHYKLERISGRYQDISQETSAKRSVHALHDMSSLDVWQIARRHPSWLPFVDAIYGSASYAPLYDSANYEVYATQSGLIIRPSNEAAKKALSGWR